MKKETRKLVYWFGAPTGALFIVFIIAPTFVRTTYRQNEKNLVASIVETGFVSNNDSQYIPTHIKTPEPVKAIYMSSWVAGTPHLRDGIINIIDTTEINSIVIDIKDYSGKISFEINSKEIQELGSSESRIQNIEAFIHILHEKNIYAIGRIAVFQDIYLSDKWTSDVIMDARDNTTVWKDEKGSVWLDPSSEKVWDYTIDLSKIAYDLGFDEINYDYIQFPIDGTPKVAYYPLSNKELLEGKSTENILENFFSYLNKKLPKNIVTSATLLENVLTTPNNETGQTIENTIPYFDFISPMIFPSHFPPQWNGYDNPATKPYEVITYSLEKGLQQLTELKYTQSHIRPWLQDFNLGTTYTQEIIRDEITAVYDSGFTSWMLWDPANTYTTDALLID